MKTVSSYVKRFTKAVGPATQYYSYDANGNVQSDSYRGVAFVIYDINNQPVSEYETNGKQIQYYYDANGQRCHKYDGSANTFYVAGKDGNTDVLTFDNSTTPTYNTWGRDNLGQVQRNGSTLTRFYYLKDHLGSIRMTVNSTGDTTSWDDYDAWGMPLEQRSGNLGQANAKYKFTGKELDQETGYDYFGARYYDARIGRFLSVDPLAGKYPRWSAYTYSCDNPLRFIDPTGCDVHEDEEKEKGRDDQVENEQKEKEKELRKAETEKSQQPNSTSSDRSSSTVEQKQSQSGISLSLSLGGSIAVADLGLNLSIGVAFSTSTLDLEFFGQGGHSLGGGASAGGAFVVQRGDLDNFNGTTAITSDDLNTNGRNLVIGGTYSAIVPIGPKGQLAGVGVGGGPGAGGFLNFTNVSESVSPTKFLRQMINEAFRYIPTPFP